MTDHDDHLRDIEDDRRADWQEMPAEVGIREGLHFDMPNADYHADQTYLSSSRLKSMLPDHYGPPPTDPNALDVGTVFHARALGTPEDVVIVDAATWTGKAAKEARAEAHAAGAVPILAHDSAMVDRMVASLRDHPHAMRLLTQPNARPEVSCFARDGDGMRVKARFDLLAPVAVDLKSTIADTAHKEELERAVVNYGYDLSAAHYLDVADALDLDVAGFALVFVSKKPPHRVAVTELTDAFLARGADLVRLAKHRHNNPTAPRCAADQGLVTLDLPRWAKTPEGIPA